MALYEYKCKQCSFATTVSRGMAEPEQAVKCGSCNIDLIRVYSSIGVAFNGSGFYSTDK